MSILDRLDALEPRQPECEQVNLTPSGEPIWRLEYRTIDELVDGGPMWAGTFTGAEVVAELERRIAEAAKPQDRPDESILPAIKCVACQQWVSIHQASRRRINDRPIDLCNMCREALQLYKPAPSEPITTLERIRALEREQEEFHSRLAALERKPQETVAEDKPDAETMCMAGIIDGKVTDAN